MKEIDPYTRYFKNLYNKDYYIIVLKKLISWYGVENAFLIMSRRFKFMSFCLFVKKAIDYIDTNLTYNEIIEKIRPIHIHNYLKKRKIKTFTFTNEKRKEYYNKRLEKTKRTKLKKYGNENYQNVEKGKETKLKKYGNENYNNREKSNKTFKDNNSVVSKVSKYKKTCLERYGVENYFMSEEYLSNVKEKNKNEIGFEWYNQRHYKNYDNLNENFVRNNFIKNGVFLIDDFGDYFNMEEKATKYLYKRKFNIVEPTKTNTIYKQFEIFNLIKTENKLYNYKLIGLKEIDIVLPDIKLGIEYDGLIFHSEGLLNEGRVRNVDKNYHLNKTELCLKKGYTLFHIFESDNLNIWLSMINNRLGFNERIYARKCIIKELKSTEIKDFLNNNHLQGFINSSINLGLYHNNELVSVMTFSKPRFNKKYDYELIRFCNKLNTSVIGSASKLFNYFIKNYNPKSIISYANRRFSNGSIYEKLGFKFLRKTAPNYFYFKPSIRMLMSRNQFQKHKLANLLDKFDENLSESENMFNNGYRRIYDCGNLVYGYTI